MGATRQRRRESGNLTSRWKELGSRICKPNFVCRLPGRTVIPLGHALLRGSSDLPGGCGAPSRHALRWTGAPSLFGLAPCGVCPARCITAAAVRSYHTFSPLPEPCGPGGMFSVALSVECFPLLRKERARMGHPPGRYPAHCSAEFGLSSALRQRPSDPAANRVIIEQGWKATLE